MPNPRVCQEFVRSITRRLVWLISTLVVTHLRCRFHRSAIEGCAKRPTPGTLDAMGSGRSSSVRWIAERQRGLITRSQALEAAMSSDTVAMPSVHRRGSGCFPEYMRRSPGLVIPSTRRVRSTGCVNVHRTERVPLNTRYARHDDGTVPEPGPAVISVSSPATAAAGWAQASCKTHAPVGAGV